MSLVNDVKSDIKAAKKFRLSWRAKVGGLLSLRSARGCFTISEDSILICRHELRCGTWFHAYLEAKAVAALVVLGDYGSHCGASCSADSVCPMGHQLGSRPGDCRRRFGGSCLILGILFVVGKFMEGPNAPEGSSIGQ